MLSKASQYTSYRNNVRYKAWGLIAGTAPGRLKTNKEIRRSVAQLSPYFRTTKCWKRDLYKIACVFVTVCRIWPIT